MRVDSGSRIPIKVWASQIEDSCMEQARNLAALPFAISHIALMPDAHPGYGMPIGGVLFADNTVVPYAVGVDIGCGVALLEVDLSVESLGGDLQRLLDEIARRIPVGNGPGAQFDSPHTEYSPYVPVDALSDVAAKALVAGAVQLGSLGGGNHFIEIQRDEKGTIFVMLHSGSRSVGKKICDHWHKIALGLNQRWHSALPDKELAYLPFHSDEGQAYFRDMQMAMEWAEMNRAAMLKQVGEALLEVCSATAKVIVDVHHNYAAWENHRGRNGIVHRKGAVRADVDQVVLIPGSMGTASYVGAGTGSEESFRSCQHGAGRARSRTATTKIETEEQFIASMSGILLGGNARNARDESPFAYKDIEEVMHSSTDLVTPVSKLVPLGVVKG